MSGFLGKIKKGMARFTGKMDQYQSSITFAEAGQHEYAEKLMEEKVEDVPEIPVQLLVVGRESDFSGEIVNYALEMAQRMSYEIVALNTAPLSCDTFKFFSSSRTQICQDFQSMSEKNAARFQEQAEKQGIPFTHVIKFSETDAAVEEICKEGSGIEFVVTDASERAANRLENDQRPKQEIFVYSMT